MKNISLQNVTKKSAGAAVFSGLAALLVLWASNTHAAQANGGFSVLINLQSSQQQQNSRLCRSGTQVGTFGAAMIVECATGTAASYAGNPSDLPWTTMLDNSSYRFVTNVDQYGGLFGIIDRYDSYAEAGTVTTWRKVRLDKMNYFEMMLHW